MVKGRHCMVLHNWENLELRWGMIDKVLKYQTVVIQILYGLLNRNLTERFI